MDLNCRLTANRIIKFDEKKEKDNDKETPLSTEASEPEIETPELKPVTLSIQDVLASYNQGNLRVVSTTGNNNPPNIDDGVTNFLYKGSEVTTYKKDDLLGIQIRGDVDPEDILKNLRKLVPVEPEPTNGTNNSNGVNGEIDENVSQGGTGDCWVLTGVLALSSSEIGKKIIKESIQVNNDGSVTVHFKGLGVSYTISAAEIKKHDTDNIKNDAYSNGDNDMLVLELATKKLMADIASGKVKLDVPADSVEAIYNKDGSIEGGFAQNMIYYLTGQQADFIYAYDNQEKGLSENEVISFLKEAYKNGNSVLTFGLYGSGHIATTTDGVPYKLNISGGHALAITNLTATTVTFVNPWDSSKEYTMTYEEFAKLGIGMLTATDLSELDDTEPEDPEIRFIDKFDIDINSILDIFNPDPNGEVYEADMLNNVPQSIIDTYLVPNEFNADGSVKNYVPKPPCTKLTIAHSEADETSGLKVTVRSEVDGKTKFETISFYTKEELNNYIGSTFWQSKLVCSIFFNYDEKTGLYSLKPGKTLDTLKPYEPDPKANPETWTMHFSNVEDKDWYSVDTLQTYLDQNLIELFFTPESSPTDEVVSLKEPYTEFKLKSDTRSDRTYEFSYKKDGKIYTTTVKIDKSDGSYTITSSIMNYFKV